MDMIQLARSLPGLGGGYYMGVQATEFVVTWGGPRLFSEKHRE